MRRIMHWRGRLLETTSTQSPFVSFPSEREDSHVKLSFTSFVPLLLLCMHLGWRLWSTLNRIQARHGHCNPHRPLYRLFCLWLQTAQCHHGHSTASSPAARQPKAGGGELCPPHKTQAWTLCWCTEGHVKELEYKRPALVSQSLNAI